MKEIDINKIRGKWEEVVGIGGTFRIAGGDDTIESVKMVAEKVNEIIKFINSYKILYEEITETETTKNNG